MSKNSKSIKSVSAVKTPVAEVKAPIETKKEVKTEVQLLKEQNEQLLAAVAELKVKKATKAKASKFTGTTINILKTDTTWVNGGYSNPRRAHTHGNNSFNIVIEAKGSISYEDYKKQGGRNNDLSWDIDHGYLQAVEAKVAAEAVKETAKS